MSSQAVAVRRALPSGAWGTIAFVATEATLFGTLVGTYFFLRFKNANWPPPGIDTPKVAVPLILTGVLVATSVPIHAAFAAARRGRVRSAWLALLVAFVVQTGYFAMQIHLFADDLHKFSPRDSAYGSIYFTLLGTHHAHVLVGLLLDVWFLLRLLGGLTSYRVKGLRCAAVYWHFVNAAALVVVGTQLSASV
jgi:heme/copper-type cytochrome/quinol oxidase subunit 3